MYKCKICGKKYKDLASLYNHIESKHSEMIPKDMSVQQYYYYMKTGKSNGNCVMCKQPTSWNMNTNKYNRFCGNPKCKEKYVSIMKGRMIAKYGKAHLLNDPNKQREMLANRSISGTYEWSDGKHKTTYTGSYELDFLKTLDNFFEWDPDDISMPSPHTYTYEYEGERKFYIPDVFIHSLDLEIEIKDGGDNPNRHHKIQDVDKVKEKLKDEVLTTQKNFHYVKITNKNYSNFFDFLKEVKNEFEKYGDDKKIPRIFKTEDIRVGGTPIKESYEDIEEAEIIEERFEIDKFLVWFDKPGKKLLGGNVKLYHATPDHHNDEISWNVGDVVTPDSVNVGSTRFSDPRLSIYFWDNVELAHIWGIFRSVEGCLYTGNGNNTKLVLSKPDNMDKEGFINSILKEKPYFFLYEVEAPSNKLEIGSSPIQKEYTISEPIQITNKTKIVVTRDMLNKYVDIVDEKDVDKYLDINANKAKFSRNFILRMLLNSARDEQRGVIIDGIRSGKIKYVEDLKKYKRVINQLIKESYGYEFDIFEEGFARDVVEKIDTFNKRTFRESDILLSLQYDLVKGSPKELQEFLTKLIKGAKYKDDLIYVNDLVGKSETYYHNLLKKRPELKNDYNSYHNWTYTGMRKEMKSKMKKIGESFEDFENELLEEKFEPDKLLVWLDKPKEKLLNSKIRLYHAAPKYDDNLSKTFNVGDTVNPYTLTSGATKLSNPRLAMYFWDNKDFAMHWGVFSELRDVFGEKAMFFYSANTSVKSIMYVSSSMEIEEVINITLASKCAFYIYETEVPANKLEIGSLEFIKEYTLSEPFKIIKKTKVDITKDILLKYVEIINNVDIANKKLEDMNNSRKSVRGLASLFMNEYRDGYRGKIQRDIIQNHNGVVNDKMFNDYRKRINKSIKAGVTDRLLETPEAFDLLEEKFEPDKFLVWFDKPVKKLVKGKLRIYHGSSDLIEGDTISPMSFNVGATKHSDPRWSTYFWDNKEDAMKWASAWEVSNYHRETLYIGHNGKTMLGKPKGMEDKEFAKELINKMSKARFYIYECEVDIKDLEIGSCPSIKEYTVSKPVTILKRYDYTLNKEILRRCFNMLPVDDVIDFKEKNKGVKHLKLHRNFILNHVLDNTRDSYRAIMRTDLRQGNIKIGDDLSGYKDSINYHVKNDTYGLKESYITDIMEESSISMYQLNLYLQNQYEEEMKHYLDTYKQYYEIMQKEKPHAVKNLNEDIKRAIIFIDGLASKGVENNLVQFAREELGNIVNIPKKGNAVKIHEASGVINVKLIYENSNARQLFGLTDTKSQVIVNDEFVIRRDKIGNHCSVSPLVESTNYNNTIEFELQFNDDVEYKEQLMKNVNEGVCINTMYNFKDMEYNFIKEACLKLFGCYPSNITKK